MIITQGAAKEKVTLSMAFKEYEDMFFKKTPTKLPPSQPYDHAIKLKDLFVLQQAKVYLLNPIKHQACKEFIPSCAILFCQKEISREILPLSRLLVSQ